MDELQQQLVLCSMFHPSVSPEHCWLYMAGLLLMAHARCFDSLLSTSVT
jgi:hypothetical protein